MSKTITLNLNKQLIIEAVKADSFLTGQIDKAEDAVKNASLAYNEQAGDETYQERKLVRTLRSAVAKFEANLAEFVDSAVGSISDTLANAGSDGKFTITVIVSDRYQNGLAGPLSSLAEEYIINVMDYTWWQAIKPSLAETYFKFASDSITHIRLCLAKTAPTSSAADYSSVKGEVTNVFDITFERDSYTATMGQSFVAPNPFTNPTGVPLMYISSDTTKATVNPNTGAVTLVAPGTTVITAKNKTHDYTDNSASYTLTINPASEP